LCVGAVLGRSAGSALALETIDGYTAFFGANSPVEAAATFNCSVPDSHCVFPTAPPARPRGLPRDKRGCPRPVPTGACMPRPGRAVPLCWAACVACARERERVCHVVWPSCAASPCAPACPLAAFVGGCQCMCAWAACASATGLAGDGWTNATGVVPIGAPLPEAVWRTNHGFAPTVMATQEPLFNDTVFR
jgi:hypothetical protein